MIWMLLELTEVPDSESSLRELSEQIRRRGVLGGTVLRVTDSIGFPRLLHLVERVAGFVPLVIDIAEWEQPDEAEQAMALLNCGADALIVREPLGQTISRKIPDDRILVSNGRGACEARSEGLCLKMTSIESLASFSCQSESGRIEPVIIDAEPESAGWGTQSGEIADFCWDRLRIDSPNGLVPVVVVDRMGTALGLAWSSRESFRTALREFAGCYWSRSRQEIWLKGATSGARQVLWQIDVDCDNDALRFTVEQAGAGFCHLERWSCFGRDRYLSVIEHRLTGRIAGSDPESYTKRLASDREKLGRKLIEEAGELSRAETPFETTWEAADVLYFTMIAMQRKGVVMADVIAELGRRMKRIERRPEKPADLV